MSNSTDELYVRLQINRKTMSDLLALPNALEDPDIALQLSGLLLKEVKLLLEIVELPPECEHRGCRLKWLYGISVALGETVAQLRQVTGLELLGALLGTGEDWESCPKRPM